MLSGTGEFPCFRKNLAAIGKQRGKFKIYQKLGYSIEQDLMFSFLSESLANLLPIVNYLNNNTIKAALKQST